MEICAPLSRRTNRIWPFVGFSGSVYRQTTVPHLYVKGKSPAKDRNTEPEEQHDAEEERQPPRYFCKICDTPVGFVGDEDKVGDIPIVSAHLNPYGFVHEVLTIRFVQNCFFHGNPVPADSWFPGFLWVYCICKRCHEHLGWAYFRPNETTYRFVGLRRAAIKQ